MGARVKDRPREIYSWALYDWANSAFATSVIGTLFPVLFKSYWNGEGVAATESTFRLGVATALSASARGIARGALAAYLDVLSERFKIAFGEAAREDPHSQVKLAQAHSMVDAAWLQLERNIGDVTEAAKRGEVPDLLTRARLRHAQAYGVSRAVEATDLCFESSGGGVLRDGHPLQRFWRDVHAARQHAINDYERAATLYGRALLGSDVSGDPMV